MAGGPQRFHRGWLAALAAAAATLPGGGVAGATAGPALAVDGGAPRHAISPYIYGLNFADPALGRELELPVDRWGGNATDTYNWQLGSDNTGSDYFFENVADCWTSADSYCSGEGATNNVFAYRDFVSKDASIGAATLMTLPMMGYVAKDAPLHQPLTCGFPKAAAAGQTASYPTQDSVDPYDPNCGNAMSAGAQLTGTPANDGTPITPAYDGAFVRDLISRYGSAAAGGVAIYELGNEPALWDSTHADMHPAPTTYDELWQKTRETAIAVKAADPTAEVLGFAEWGWPNYFCSAADDIDNGCSASSPDRAAHGGVPLVEWLLQQAHGYEQTNGERLIDDIDVHYYAQGADPSVPTDITRSLWDPSYTDPSWIGQQIDLIPRMHQWVADDYPGTRISLSEYNLDPPGGNDAVANALIQADTLGIFGREGLDLATRWPLGNDGDLIDDAFRMFRDYDGNHSQFGDVSLSSTSADQSRLAIYGAQRTSDGAYTVLVVNKTATALTSALALSSISAAPAAQVWEWTGGAITRTADQPVGTAGFTMTYPARSLTLFVLPAAIVAGPPGQGPPTTPASPGTHAGTAPRPKGPSCTLTPTGSRVRLRRTRTHGPHSPLGPPAGVLEIAIVCRPGARLSLAASITVRPRPRRGHRHPKPGTLPTVLVDVSARAGRRTPMTIRLPVAALAALKAGAHESVALLLAASDPGGATIRTARIASLRLR
jgi:hypothetical protein